MRLSGLTLMAILATFSHAEAQEIVIAKSCAGAADTARCESWRQQVRLALPKAYEGDRQSQATVILCLTTGCREAVKRDAVTACAWRLVIANAPDAPVLSRGQLIDNCSGLQSDQKTTARQKATEIFSRIYKGRQIDFSNDV